MKKSLILYLLLLSYINIFPQTYSIFGIVADSSNKKILIGANVTLSSTQDSHLQGMPTDEQGKFLINNLKAGKYTLTISFIGYTSKKRNIQIQNRNLDFHEIYLSPVSIRLNTVQVTAEPIPVVLKSDTAEYNAGAFKTNKDAVAEDLLTKMPGITVQNGKVQAQGENVAKVLVDGKEFFGSDPDAVLKNLPAEVIEKIQVFDQQSDQSQFTGFDDGNTSKTLNIVTRLRDRQGTFGKLSGGYGDDDRYAAGGNINFFNKDQRISIITQFNNVNQQNFSSEDLLGVMSGNGRQFNRAAGGMGNIAGGGGRPAGSGGAAGLGSGPGGFGGNNTSNFLVSQSTGLTQTKALGVNFSDKWGDKVDLTASYFFNLTNNDAESITNRDYFLSSPAQEIYNDLNSAITKNTNHRINLRLNYQIDSSNSILFYPSFTAQINDGSSKVSGVSAAGTDTLNTTANLFNSDLTALNSSNNLLIRHKFETKGRTLSIGLNGTFTQNKGDNDLNAEDNYYSGSFTSDTIDQSSTLMQHGLSGFTNVVYTEPVSTYGLIQLNGKLYYSEDHSNQETYNILDNLSLRDTSLSNVYKKIYRTQSFGTGYLYRQDKFSLALNLNYNSAQLANSSIFPVTGLINRNFNSILPSFFVRYFISRNNNLRISYSTNNDDPSINQLQNVLNNSNPTQLSIGNPALSQDYKQSLVLRYIQTDPQKMSSFFILLGATAIHDYIGNNTIIAQQDTTVLNNIFLNTGTKLSTPQNLDGYYNIHSFFAYGFPIGFVKSNLNLSLGLIYTRTPGIINDITNYANTSTVNFGFVLGSNINEKVDFTLSSFGSANYVKNSSQSGGNSNYLMENLSLKFYWRFCEGFVFQNEFNDQYNGNLNIGQTGMSGSSAQGGSNNPNTFIWNMSLGIKLLKDDGGELRFTANDILNQNINIQHNITDSYIEDVRTNVLGRYYMLSFIYSIRAF